VSNDCPLDVKRPAGSVCRAQTGDCDIEEQCDGQVTKTQTHKPNHINNLNTQQQQQQQQQH
jgi:hypothetical protein